MGPVPKKRRQGGGRKKKTTTLTMPRVSEGLVELSQMARPLLPDASKLGWKLHEESHRRMKQFEQMLEIHYTWIQEALIEAKKTLTLDDVMLIPSTPSVKRTHQTLRCRNHLQSETDITEEEEEEEEDQDTETEQPKKKPRATGKRTTSRSRRKGPDSSQEDSSATSEPRSTRARRPNSAQAPSTGRATRNSTRKQAAEENTSGGAGPVMCLATSTIAEEQVMDTDEEHERAPRNTTASKTSLGKAASKGDRKFREIDTASEANNTNRRKTRSTGAKTEVLTNVSTCDPVKENDSVLIIEDSDQDDNLRGRTDTTSDDVTHTPKDDSPVCRLDSGNPTTPSSGSAPIKVGYMKVKERISAYESHVNKSIDETRSPGSASRPAGGRKPTPRTPLRSTRQASPHTPPTIIVPASKSRSTLVKCLARKPLGTSPALTGRVAAVAASATPRAQGTPAGQKMRRSQSRRSSTVRRVSGVRVSLSKRRSSMARHKANSTLLSTCAAVANQVSMIVQAKHKLNATVDSSCAADTESTPEPQRSTRSKLRLNKTNNHMQTPTTISSSSSDDNHPATPPTTRTALQRAQSRMRLASPDSDGEGTPTADSNGYRSVAPPSTMAPMRTTRSKMRKFQQQQTTDSPSVTRNAPQVAEMGKRTMTNSESENQSPPKRPCIEDSLLDADTPDSPGYPCHPSSFLNSLQKSRITPNNMSTVKSFIQRNTPTKKISTQEMLEQRRQQLKVKEKQGEDRVHKRQEYLQKRAEEQRKRREERMLLVAKRREDQIRRDREMKREYAQKLEEKKNMTARAFEEKLREEREKSRQREKKMTEAETRRKLEEENRLHKLQETEVEQKRLEELQQRKREYEEQERQRRLAEQRRQQEDRLADLERERDKEQERQRTLEEQKTRELHEKQKQREEREKRERAERERLEFERQREKERLQKIELEKKREYERQRFLERQAQESAKLEAARQVQEELEILKKYNNNTASKPATTNTSATLPSAGAAAACKKAAGAGMNTSYTLSSKPALNTTATKNTTALNTTVTKETGDSQESESYDMTPVRKVYKQANTEENYNIEDLRSDDSTDDEDRPRKKIPPWATGPQLRAALISQYYHPPDLDQVFDQIVPPDLNMLFHKKKARFNKRTSSAVWHSPMYKPSGKPVE